MTGDEAYDWLTAASHAGRYDAFDSHVVASILAIAIDEMKDGDRSLWDGTGIDGPDLRALAAGMFPNAAAALGGLTREGVCLIDDEEHSLREIMMMFATGESALERPLASMIARRCKSPRHLWQDLGLRQRSELSQLMQRHFAPLAARNKGDMKWKKFLYRMVCGSEGFTLCTAPVCSDCDDFVNCFGAEDGQSILARARNDRSVAA